MSLEIATRPPRAAAVVALMLVMSAASRAVQPATPPTRGATSALINRQLDKAIRLQLDNSPLPAVLDSIETQTGVPVRVSDDTYAALPYGVETPITATVENLSLRDALEAIAGKLGLRVERRDEYVELAPHPALRRLGRRVTLQELRTLDVLAARPLPSSGSGPADEPRDALALARDVDAALVAYDAELTRAGRPAAEIVVELRVADPAQPPPRPVRPARGATLLAALEALEAQTDLTWYPWGDGVVVSSKRGAIRGLLERPADLRYEGVDVAQVFADLAQRTGVAFSIEPGAIQRVPPEFRIIRLASDAPIRQTLESLQGFTGLGYVITDEGVYVWNQNSTPAVAAGRGRVVATVEVTPGTNVLVYEDQLSQAARDALDERRRAAARTLEAGLVPTTAPAGR